MFVLQCSGVEGGVEWNNGGDTNVGGGGASVSQRTTVQTALACVDLCPNRQLVSGNELCETNIHNDATSENGLADHPFVHFHFGALI